MPRTKRPPVEQLGDLEPLFHSLDDLSDQVEEVIHDERNLEEEPALAHVQYVELVFRDKYGRDMSGAFVWEREVQPLQSPSDESKTA